MRFVIIDSLTLTVVTSAKTWDRHGDLQDAADALVGERRVPYGRELALFDDDIVGAGNVGKRFDTASLVHRHAWASGRREFGDALPAGTVVA